MEFTGVGAIPYEPPPEDLKPFFRKKYRTIFRFINRMFGGGDLTKKHLSTMAQTVAGNAPVDEQEKGIIYKREFDTVCHLFLFGRESISEEEYIDEWIDTAFNNCEKRKDMMNFIQKNVQYAFETVDTDHNGKIDVEEFEAWYKIRTGNVDTIKRVFEAIDVNGDGGISLMEWGYAVVDCHFNSGPENMNSLFFGTLVDDD